MIKVLVVEDDKLVRKSFIQSFQWEKFDMEIVGDAKNGEKALEFMEKTPVDLLITDLAMPIMTGIELIRIVKKRYPSIFIVVLSLHQDFEYIQEAMRLEVLDYIAKVELDENNMDEILLRIQQRIATESEKQKNEPLDIGYILLSHQMSNIIGVLKDELNTKLIVVQQDYVLIKKDEMIQEKLLNLIGNRAPFVLVKIEATKDLNQIEEWLRYAKERILFYELYDEKPMVVTTDIELIQRLHVEDESTIECWIKKIRTSNWITDSHAFQTLLTDLYKAQFSSYEIRELIVWTVHDYKIKYPSILPDNFTPTEKLNNWMDVKHWFFKMKKILYATVFSTSYPLETNQSIQRAISIIEEQIATPLTAKDVAHQVNMSRSYFSICFKEIMGYTFNQYIRMVRMNKAKNYLSYTRHKIGVIAEKVGYTDIKYFSRVFRQETGLLPSEYRKINKKGSDVSDV